MLLAQIDPVYESVLSRKYSELFNKLYWTLVFTVWSRVVLPVCLSPKIKKLAFGNPLAKKSLVYLG